MAKQLAFGFAKKKRKARRPAASKPGPKPRAERIGFVAHGRRDPHEADHPLHVTMRCVARAPSLRAELVLKAVARVLARGIARGIAVVHYSIQENHLHLIVEAGDKTVAARGLQWLFSRIAFEVNRVALRSGSLFPDRHFRHELKSPSEMRRALVYVLMNGRKHLAEQGVVHDGMFEWLDPCSSAAWLPRRAWRGDDAPAETVIARVRAGPCPPGAMPSTWLASTGWRRGGGALRLGEMPALRVVR